MPPDMLATDNTPEGLNSDTFDELRERRQGAGYVTSRAILSPRNVDVEDINTRVLEMLPGEVSLLFKFQAAIPAFSC